ncbi:hypothetical protein [Methylobacterium sp. 1973]|uniref:hypothetical protein n=1 Tax=Methylobacterium sp. 1973 TaxID=3156421 RepID=UPI003391FC4B
MTAMIKVLPTAEEHVGLVHPVDGPLAAEGNDWTHDAFTERRIQEQVIRRFEAGVDDAAPAEAKAAAKVKAQAPA